MSKAITRLQHADPHRKYLLRKRLMRWLDGIEGCAVVPFAGDLAIALGGRPEAKRDFRYPFPGLYADRRVYACDLDEAMVKVAEKRLTNGVVRCADANIWPFRDIDVGPVAVIDCDSFDQPFGAFRAAWAATEKAERVMAAFTSASPMGISVDGTVVSPADGSTRKVKDLPERRRLYYQHLERVVWPFLVPYLAADDYQVLDKAYYVRGMMIHFGVVAEREDCALNGMIARKR
jgi:hypothetical protein